jgi:hypothetical protein
MLRTVRNILGRGQEKLLAIYYELHTWSEGSVAISQTWLERANEKQRRQSFEVSVAHCGEVGAYIGRHAGCSS